MTYTLTPKQGDKVRVRLHDGRAVDSEYYFKAIGKENFVSYKDTYYCCGRRLRFHSTESYFCARFIYPLSLMPKPEVRE